MMRTQLRILGWLAIVGAIAVPWERVCAQITPDGTLGEERSVVTPEVIREKPSARIDGGAKRGANLFHSFREFNVGEGRGAYFSNPNGVENIFSRVTGGSRSNILGTLGVLGEANLFLINPNGILFGPNANLDVPGSFTATTANGIRFGEQGDFDTINAQSPQLLTVNPSAYLFNQIANQNINGIKSQGVLQVPQGKSLVFLGGDINLVGSVLAAPGGRIELASVNDTREIILNEDSGLVFTNEIGRGDIFLSGGSEIGVVSEGGGSINIFSKNLQLIEGSQLIAGIGEELGDFDAIGGNISINLTGELGVVNGFILNNLFSNGEGTIGNVEISANSVSVTNGGQIYSLITGKGNGGNITLDISDYVIIDGVNQSGQSGIFSQLQPGKEGNASNILIKTASLKINNSATVLSNTFGKGNAGNITIDAADSVIIDGEEIAGQPSSIVSQIREGGEGNAGDILVTTASLEINNGSFLAASTFSKGNGGDITINASDSVILDGVGSNGEPGGVASRVRESGEGNAGDISITTTSLEVNNGAIMTNDTFGRGNAGDITLNISDSIIVDGVGTNNASSAVLSEVREGGKGNAGDISITTTFLKVNNGAFVSTSTRNQGDAGTLTIDASNLVILDGVGRNDQSSALGSAVLGGIGKAGNVNIKTNILEVINGAFISNSTFGIGDAGTITIDASDSVFLDGEGINRQSSGILSQVQETAVGNAGNIQIETNFLQVTNGAFISTTNLGKGDAGNIIINASDSVLLDGESIDGRPAGIASQVEGIAASNPGTINITTKTLKVLNSALISTTTAGKGDAGTIIINAADSVTIDGKTTHGIFSAVGSSVTPEAEGNGGKVLIITDSLKLTDSAAIVTSTQGQGRGGNIQINANSIGLAQNAEINSLSTTEEEAGDITLSVVDTLVAENSSITSSSSQSAGGEIQITAEDIRLRGNSDILTNVNRGVDSGGDITLNANSILAFDDSDILAFADDGQGGNITLDTPVFFGSRFEPAPQDTDPDTLDGNERVDINASGAVASGAIDIPDVSFLQNSLTELPVNAIATETLIANSCVVPSGRQRGTFIITGAGGLPVRPGDASVSSYPTGTVRTVPNDESSRSGASRPWQKGDPIVEPTGTYRLANGKLVMSRECSQ